MCEGEWTFSRQGLFPATSFFQAEAFSTDELRCYGASFGGFSPRPIFLSECCMAQRFVVLAVALLSAKLSEKTESLEMIVIPTSSACRKQGTRKKHGTNRGKERRQPPEGVEATVMQSKYNGFFLLRRCLGKSRADRPSVS